MGLAEQIKDEMAQKAEQFMYKDSFLKWVSDRFKKGSDVVKIHVAFCELYGNLRMADRFYFGPDNEFADHVYVCFDYHDGHHFMYPTNHPELTADISGSELAWKYIVNEDDLVAKKTILSQEGFVVSFLKNCANGTLEVRLP